ncbi:sensor histidine kinase [Salinisphaera sp.]|uniref:sensor histidine kinase n=1 Tax=Salinisphaera sp. TaxID=1914330 RepID=UPI002D78A91F|nr:ATP-binding protein [Salinisphaera sp.]HET7315381.1 ATP-binding protein [Salinisphaera sp.]
MSKAQETPSSPLDDPDTAREQIRSLRADLASCQARAEAAERETRCFRELAEHIQEVFWMTNPLGDELIYISPAYEHIWGQPCASLHEDPGRRLAWVHDDDRERVLTAFKRDAAEGDYDEVFRINRPDGGIRWIRDRAFPVRDDSGEVYRLAGFAIDLTDEVESRDHMTELQNLIATRERISVFASLGTGLAHDLAQPLTSARNFVTGALSIAREENSDQADLLVRAEYQIQRAASIIRHLRDFAREGHPTINQQALFPMLSEVRELLAPSLRAERISLDWPQAEDLAGLELPIDRIFTQQVLRNLIGNAVEALASSATADDERRIRLWVDSGHAQQVDIYVEDNGDGIDEDVALFSPFMTTKGSGLGLGLSVSRSLARSHGGDLHLVSRGRDGSGPTCFMLRLPREFVAAA